jgi:hypothetical protein
MRCLSCNNILSDFESTRKYKNTQSYIDLCTLCFNESDLKLLEVTERTDLKHDSDEELNDGFDDY